LNRTGIITTEGRRRERRRRRRGGGAYSAVNGRCDTISVAIRLEETLEVNRGTELSIHVNH